MAFLDSAGYKRKLIAVSIKESEFSETNLDELLMRLIKAQERAFDVYQLIDRKSVESQIMNIEGIKERMLNASTQNTQGGTDDVFDQIQEFDKKTKNLKDMAERYSLKIESLRHKMNTNKLKILDWDW